MLSDIVIFPRVPFKKRYLNTARHSFARKSELFCAIFSSDLQQTLNKNAAVVKFRLDIYSNEVCCNKSIISVKVGEIGETKVLSAPLRSSCTCGDIRNFESVRYLLAICSPICTLNQMQRSRHRFPSRWLNLMLAVCSRQSIFMVVAEKCGWLWAHMF
jgi:hypothetical protein